jgi:hypothetical protein
LSVPKTIIGLWSVLEKKLNNLMELTEVILGRGSQMNQPPGYVPGPAYWEGGALATHRSKIYLGQKVLT